MANSARGKSRVEHRQSKLAYRKSKRGKANEELPITVTPARIVAPDQRSTLTAPVSGPSAMFELFPDLPVELRAKIWEMAEPAPRKADVLFKNHWSHKVHEFKADVPTLVVALR